MKFGPQTAFNKRNVTDSVVRKIKHNFSNCAIFGGPYGPRLPRWNPTYRYKTSVYGVVLTDFKISWH